MAESGRGPLGLKTKITKHIKLPGFVVSVCERTSRCRCGERQLVTHHGSEAELTLPQTRPDRSPGDGDTEYPGPGAPSVRGALWRPGCLCAPLWACVTPTSRLHPCPPCPLHPRVQVPVFSHVRFRLVSSRNVTEDTRTHKGHLVSHEDTAPPSPPNLAPRMETAPGPGRAPYTHVPVSSPRVGAFVKPARYVLTARQQ